MKLSAGKSKPIRRKVDADMSAGIWESAIDSLAMTLCPVEEWQEYERRMHQLSWQAGKTKRAARVHVFPVWRRYRQQALRVITLHRALPVLRYLPLRISCFLGEILFK